MSNQAELLREAAAVIRNLLLLDADNHRLDDIDLCAEIVHARNFLAKIDAATLVPEGADIAAEYLEAKRVIDAGPLRPDSGFAPPRSWRHNDPEVIRWHKAVAALSMLAASVRQDGAR